MFHQQPPSPAYNPPAPAYVPSYGFQPPLQQFQTPMQQFTPPNTTPYHQPPTSLPPPPNLHLSNNLYKRNKLSNNIKIEIGNKEFLTAWKILPIVEFV